MFNISDFLQRFSHLTPPDEFVRKQVVECLQRQIGITIPLSQVLVKEGVVFLKVSPVVKNHVFIKKDAILAQLQTSLAEKAPRDIR